MRGDFFVYVERLKEGGEESLSGSYAPTFLNIEEEGLSFLDPVELLGKAYVMGDHLLLSLAIKTQATMPCLLCNSPMRLPLSIAKFHHAEALAEIRSGIFDFTELVREAILLEVPIVTECNGGNCPEREAASLFFKRGS